LHHKKGENKMEIKSKEKFEKVVRNLVDFLIILINYSISIILILFLLRDEYEKFAFIVLSISILIFLYEILKGKNERKN
jgi:hypothetical protein